MAVKVGEVVRERRQAQALASTQVADVVGPSEKPAADVVVVHDGVSTERLATNVAS